MDSEGICESLCFVDVCGCCCWCLYLLFDSDYLVWDWLVGVFLVWLELISDGGVVECLWCCLVVCFGGELWCMCVLCLYVVEEGFGLVVSLVLLLLLGVGIVCYIVDVEGVEGELWVDDCCCVIVVCYGLCVDLLLIWL